MKRFIHIGCILIVIAGLLFGQGSALSRYLAGNRAYRDGDYTAAIQAYNEAIAEGANDYRVYYNLGNAYFRIGEIGEAVLSYERARFLAPRNDDVLENLKYVRSTRVDIVEDVDEDRVGNIYENTFLGIVYGFLAKIAFREFLTVLITLSALGAVALVCWILISERKRRWFFLIAVVAWGLAIIILVPYTLKLKHPWETQLAIITAPKAEIRSGPSQNSQLKFTFREGMDVAVRETREEYSHVLLRNGEEGWVLSERIERVIPK